MLLSITTTAEPASDLGYLLHKHPARVQSFELAFGTAQVFYPVALRELGLEALDRVVRGEPLWRVPECMFAMPALESEPVDPACSSVSGRLTS